VIYINKRGTLSRQLSGYVQASTDNPTGWRPQYTRLGAERAPINKLPDWKVAAAARDRRARRNGIVAAGRQQMAGLSAAIVDARARGVRFNPRLSGLGSLDPNSLIVSGGQYFFHMGCGGIFIGCPQNMSDVNNSLSGDSNFSNVQASPESTGFVVSFTYAGQGGGYSSIQSVGMEMAQVISSNLTGLQSISFLSADGPTGLPAPAGTSGITPPPTPPSSSWTSWLAAMGLSATAGAAVAIGGGVLLLMMLRE
jgi:hypothetical protein